jgi:hypothetical protein
MAGQLRDLCCTGARSEVVAEIEVSGSRPSAEVNQSQRCAAIVKRVYAQTPHGPSFNKLLRAE